MTRDQKIFRCINGFPLPGSGENIAVTAASAASTAQLDAGKTYRISSNVDACYRLAAEGSEVDPVAVVTDPDMFAGMVDFITPRYDAKIAVILADPAGDEGVFKIAEMGPGYYNV